MRLSGGIDCVSLIRQNMRQSNLEHVPLANCDAKVLFDGGMCGNLRTQRPDLVLKRLVLLPQRCVSVQEWSLSDVMCLQTYLQAHAASSHVSRTCGCIHQDIAPSWGLQLVSPPIKLNSMCNVHHGCACRTLAACFWLGAQTHIMVLLVRHADIWSISPNSLALLPCASEVAT